MHFQSETSVNLSATRQTIGMCVKFAPKLSLPTYFFFFISCCNVVVLPLSSSSVNVHVVSLAEKSISWKKHRTQFSSWEFARAEHPRLEPIAKYCKWPQPMYHFKHQASSTTGYLNYHLSRLQAAHVKEGSRIKESSLPLQQTSQITRNFLLIRETLVTSVQKTAALINTCNTNSNWIYLLIVFNLYLKTKWIEIKN